MSFVIFVVNEIKIIVPGCPQGSLKQQISYTYWLLALSWTSRKWATRYRGIEYRAVIATAAIEVTVELP